MARPPNTGPEYPDEIVTDREIQPLTAAGGKVPTLFIIIAAIGGFLVLALLQLFSGGDEVEDDIATRPVVTIPAATPDELPTPRPVLPPPPAPEVDPEAEDDGGSDRFDQMNLLELERQRQIALLEEEKRRLEAARQAEIERKRRERLNSSMLLFDDGGSAPASTSASNDQLSDLIVPEDYQEFGEGDPNEANELITSRENRFLRDAANEQVVKAQAVKLADHDFLLTQGTFITGITETAIDSDLPGMIRAIVDKPVYSRTGKNILVPKGSRLIGRYQSGITTGQKRVYIVWSRMERPDGVVIALGSPGADSLGRSGMAGNVDTHFFERFGASTLLSAIGPALSALLDDGNQSANTQEIIQGGRQGFERQSAIALQNSINIPPTIRVPQGSEITIFVNRDLSFASVDG